MSEMTIPALINSKLADDHRVDKTEYKEILAEVKYGWVSKDEILEAHQVVAAAEAEVGEAAGGILGAMSKALLEAVINGNSDLSGVGQQAAAALDAMERRDTAKKLAADLNAARNGDPDKGIAKQGFLANAAADLLPEKAAGWLQGLF